MREQEILAYPAFARDQHVGRAVRHLPQDLKLSKHLGISRDYLVQSKSVGQFAAQPEHFPAEFAILQRPRYYQQQLVVAERLGDVVKSTKPHGLDGGRN